MKYPETCFSVAMWQSKGQEGWSGLTPTFSLKHYPVTHENQTDAWEFDLSFKSSVSVYYVL